MLAFLPDGTKVSLNDNSVTLTKPGESWGDPWPTANQSITISDVSALIRCLTEMKREQYSEW